MVAAKDSGWLDVDRAEAYVRDFEAEHGRLAREWKDKRDASVFLKVPFRPDPLQTRVLHDDHPRKLCVWGRRRGKTTTAMLWLQKRALTRANSTCWYVAPTYKQAKRIAWQAAKRLYTTSILSKRPNESELSFTFKNGSTVTLMGAEDPDSLRGPGLWGVVLDEYGTMRQDAWSLAIRPMLSDTGGHALFIGTPNALRGPHLEQLYREIEKGALYPTWISWFSPTEDAAHIPPSEIETARKEMRPWEFRQEYEASFETLSGRVWPEFNMETIENGGHVIPLDGDKTELDCPAGWSVSVGLDWGWSHPFAAVWLAHANDGTGRCVVLAEHVLTRTHIIEHMRHIIRVCKRYGGIENCRFYADPSRPDYIDEVQNVYHLPVVPANNGVEIGVDRVGRLFAQNLLMVYDGCPNLIRGLMEYSYVPDSKAPRINKVKDDECDALRYAALGAMPPEDDEIDQHGGPSDWEEDETWKANWQPDRWEDQWAADPIDRL